MNQSCLFIGSIIKEAEKKSTNSGHSFVSFGLSVKRSEKDHDYVPCVAWSALMAKCMELKKGDIVVVNCIYTSSRRSNPDNKYGFDYFHSFQVKQIEHIKDALNKGNEEIHSTPEGEPSNVPHFLK